MRSKKKKNEIRLLGRPSEKQSLFFRSRARYTAYGGARGGGKSWALRRKLILLCFHYPGLSCLLVRRSLPELRENHLYPLLSELGESVQYTELSHTFHFPGGSRLVLGYCDSERDVLRYQGQEYDIIALDEATQLTEFQFSTFKACLRGANSFPKRIYLTCNPGGIGHAWVKRLFVDRLFRAGENPDDYAFIPAGVYDNKVLMEKDPEYVNGLRSLPDRLRRAWLEGSWDVFEGQFFPEFSGEVHVCAPMEIPRSWQRFGGLDYGFDMLAVVWAAVDPKDGTVYIYREFSRSGLTLTKAAEAVARECLEPVEYLAASPDLWNRRQDSGLSGVMLMSAVQGMPTLVKADDRRVIGWRNLREFLATGNERVGTTTASLPAGGERRPRLQIFSTCTELIRTLPALLHDKARPEDASSEPHSVTHFPEALRYALMALPEKGGKGARSPTLGQRLWDY